MEKDSKILDYINSNNQLKLIYNKLIQEERKLINDDIFYISGIKLLLDYS